MTLPVLVGERVQGAIEQASGALTPSPMGSVNSMAKSAAEAVVNEAQETWKNTGEAGLSTPARVAVTAGAVADKFVGVEGLQTACEGRDREGRELTPAARVAVGTEAGVQVAGTAVGIKGLAGRAVGGMSGKPLPLEPIPGKNGVLEPKFDPKNPAVMPPPENVPKGTMPPLSDNGHGQPYGTPAPSRVPNPNGRNGTPAHQADVAANNNQASGQLMPQKVGKRIPDGVGQPGQPVTIRGQTVNPGRTGRVITESEGFTKGGMPVSDGRGQLRDVRSADPNATIVVTDPNNVSRPPLVYPPGTQPPPSGRLPKNTPSSVPYP